MNKSTGKYFIIFIGILGVVMFSAKAVMVKLAYQYSITAVNLLMFRMLFSLPFYLIMLFMYKPDNSVKRTSKDYLALVLFGFIGYYLASFFDFRGLEYIKASIERVILFIYPTIVIILSRFFFKTSNNENTGVGNCLNLSGGYCSFLG